MGGMRKNRGRRNKDGRFCEGGGMEGRRIEEERGGDEGLKGVGLKEEGGGRRRDEGNGSRLRIQEEKMSRKVALKTDEKKGIGWKKSKRNGNTNDEKKSTQESTVRKALKKIIKVGIN